MGPSNSAEMTSLTRTDRKLLQALTAGVDPTVHAVDDCWAVVIGDGIRGVFDLRNVRKLQDADMIAHGRLTPYGRTVVDALSG